MNPTLRNKLIAVISGGALLIASVLIKDLEGVEYTPYYDVVGVLTVCYGHTGSDIIKNKVYTQSECELLLEQDLLNVANQVNQLIKVELPETTRAAIYSFVYNVGIGNFAKSTLLKKINSNDPTACSELKRWVYASGIKWKGLVNRRDIEFEVCEVYQ